MRPQPPTSNAFTRAAARPTAVSVLATMNQVPHLLPLTSLTSSLMKAQVFPLTGCRHPAQFDADGFQPPVLHQIWTISTNLSSGTQNQTRWLAASLLICLIMMKKSSMGTMSRPSMFGATLTFATPLSLLSRPFGTRLFARVRPRISQTDDASSSSPPMVTTMTGVPWESSALSNHACGSNSASSLRNTNQWKFWGSATWMCHAMSRKPPTAHQPT